MQAVIMTGSWVMQALSLSSRDELIRIARQTVEHYVKTGESLNLQSSDPELQASLPCFVTLRKRGSLRGCVGEFETQFPLIQEVVRMTRAAASEDGRFPPVEAGELTEIAIEISILNPLERISSWREVEVGRHGILVEWKHRRGVFLPEVARDQGWTAEEFVKVCALEKAGLPEAVWPEITLYRFTTEKIKEHP